MSWQAVEWAFQAPMEKNDPPARLVLAYLGTKADERGRNAFPLSLSIAHDVGLNPEVVPRVLKRLVDYGLISKDGMGPLGQPRWTLHMEMVRPADSFDVFCLRHRALASGRKARYRSTARPVDVHDSQSGTPAVHDPQSWTVPDPESGTSSCVPDSQSSCPGSTVVLSRTLSRPVHDSESPQKRPIEPSRTVLEPSPPAAPPPSAELDLGVTPTAPPKTGPKTAPKADRFAYTEAFEEAWLAYGRRGAKADAFDEWKKAIKRADISVIMSAIGPFVASTPTLRFRMYFERWLKNDGWESAVPDPDDRPTPPSRPSTTDQRVRDIESLRARYANDPRNHTAPRRELPGGIGA